MPATYSHSKLNTFDNCRFKYKLQYVDREKPKLGKGIHLFLGSMVHDTLERHYELLQQSRLLTEEELIEVYNEYWKRGWSDEYRILDKDLEPEHYRMTGEKCLKNYYARNEPFDQGITLGLEEHFIIDLPSGNKIQGYIDRLEKVGEDHIVIHDYKTSKRAEKQEKADIDPQLGLYAWAMRRRYPLYKKFDLVWHYVAVDEVVKSKRTDKQLEDLIVNTEKRIKEIEEATETQNFETNKCWLCPFCEYQPQCPEFSHLYDLETEADGSKLQTTSLTAQEASDLVDELERLENGKRENQKEIDQIKARLTEYKKESGVDTIYGTEKQVGFSKYESYAMPKKGSTERRELEALLKRMGLWNELTEFSSHRLKRMFKDNYLSEDDKDVILAFIEYENRWRLNVKNREKL